jgi:hypothetical protein
MIIEIGLSVLGARDAAVVKRLVEVTDGGLSVLGARDAAVVKLRFGLGDEPPLTLEEVGSRMGLTRERIRQIEAKFLRAVGPPGRYPTLPDHLLVLAADYPLGGPLGSAGRARVSVRSAQLLAFLSAFMQQGGRLVFPVPSPSWGTTRLLARRLGIPHLGDQRMGVGILGLVTRDLAWLSGFDPFRQPFDADSIARELEARQRSSFSSECVLSSRTSPRTQGAGGPTKVHAPGSRGLFPLGGRLVGALIKGVGVGVARRLVAYFGEDLARVLEESPEEITRVPGLGKKRAERVAHYARALASVPAPEAAGRLCFSADDLYLLGTKLSELRRKRVPKSAKVYLALRAIGRPAHFSEVARLCESMFGPGEYGEHNVHAVLSREQHGVVWLGVRGTFALREWGYERPSKTLHKTVGTIVRRKYRETGAPVPFGVIIAEVGRERRVVRRSSVMLAAHFNAELEHVGQDSFRPRSQVPSGQGDGDGEALDRMLRDFEARGHGDAV